MRFTTATSPRHQTCYDIRGDRPIAFAQDLIYFVFRMYNKNWMPLGYKTYSIHPLSPLTYRIREAILILLKDTDSLYRDKYEELAPEGSDEKLLRYLHHVRRAIRDFYSEKELSANTLLDTLLYLARLSLEFQEGGTQDAPYFACILAVKVLDEMPPDIYQIFDVLAEGVIDDEAVLSH